jgi:hypothetical protein
VSAILGSQQGAASLLTRAAQLNSARDPWMAKNGTTAAIKGQNKGTGEIKTFIATEAPTKPVEFDAVLADAEEFVEGIGHAERTIIEAKGNDWDFIEGAASRNVCTRTCKPAIENSGMQLGGPVFPGQSDKTAHRLFWRVS